MGEQAIESGEVIEEAPELIEVEEEAPAVEAQAEESPEDEIILAGEEEPASKSEAPKGFLKRINKLNSKVEAANTETEAERQRREAVEEENKLLRAKLEQGKTSGPPRLEDFDTDEAYETAKAEYDEKRIAFIAQQQAAKIVQNANQQHTQTQQAAAFNAELESHYKRAESLNVSDYEATEDAAIDLLGRDIAKQVMANTGNSELVMYHLGKNPVKAQQISAAIQQNPVKGLLVLGDLASKLTVKSKTSPAPDPETQISGGGPIPSKSQGPVGATFE